MKLRHRETGVETELESGLEIGRLDSCGLKVDDGSVSRHHARIELRQGQFWVVDQGSSNGSKHNGRGEREFPLRSGDLVTFGAVAFDVIGPAPASGAAAAAGGRSATSGSAVAGDGGAVLLEDPEEAEAGLGGGVSREVEAERARIHAELRAKGRSRGFGDLNQLPFGMQLLVGLLGLAFLLAVVYGVRWLGEAM